jgi:hypothetical protein
LSRGEEQNANTLKHQRLVCLTRGSACTLASTAEGTAPSTSTIAMASPPCLSRPRWKVAMLILASPSRPAKWPKWRADILQLAIFSASNL